MQQQAQHQSISPITTLEKYMFSIPEQFSTATKTNIEAQFAAFSTLTGKAFEGVEKLMALNLTAAKSSLEEASASTKQLLSAKDAQEFFALSAAQAQPAAEKATAYTRELAAIASSAQAEMTKTTEAQIAETNKKVLSLVDEVTKNAPAGSEKAVAMLKSAIDNANAGYEQFTKSSKQAVDTIETNMASAVSQFNQAAEKTAPKASKK
ncbi:MAG: phasin family protein [Janthinobacterium sp.]|jgi:phasin family protein